jgi:hypothetical protein
MQATELGYDTPDSVPGGRSDRARRSGTVLA